MLVGLPSEVQEEILKWCPGSDILNVALTCSEMYTETVKMLLWKSVKIDLDQLKLNEDLFSVLKHTTCLTLFKRKENSLEYSSYSTDTEEEEYLSGHHSLGWSPDTEFDYETAVWEWSNEEEAWAKWFDFEDYQNYLECCQDSHYDFENYQDYPEYYQVTHYTFEEYCEQRKSRCNEHQGQQEDAKSVGFIIPDDELDNSEEMVSKKKTHENLVLSQLDLSNLTELRLLDIHAMVCKNDCGRYYNEHSSDVLENLLRNIKNLKLLQVVHMSSLRRNEDWGMDSNSLQRSLCDIDDRVYLMNKNEFQHIEDIPYLRELKFTNIWIGKPFEIPSLEKLSVNFYTNFKVRLGKMENLRELEVNHVTLVGEDFLDGVDNLQKLKLRYCGNITEEGLKIIAMHTTHVRELDIQDNEITNEALMNLNLMFSLQSLKVGNEKEETRRYPFAATPDGKLTCLDFLKNLKDLRELVIPAAEISDDGGKVICGLEDLEELSIRRSHVSGGSVFSHLTKLTKLRHLDISHCYRSQIKSGRHVANSSSCSSQFKINTHAENSSSDAAIRQLNQIKSLQSLNIENFEGVTGAALVDFPSLQHLNTKDIKFDDSDLEYISHLTSLVQLDVSLDEEVTERGFHRLCKLPHLQNIHVWNSEPMFDFVKTLESIRREGKLPCCCVKASCDNHDPDVGLIKLPANYLQGTD